MLDALDVAYVQQQIIGKYAVDFLIADTPLVLECDGAYWHSKPGAAEKDARKDAFLREQGYAVLRLPEALIKSGQPAVDAISLAVAVVRAA
jgi:very-short-patch-repair endonuclease